ncbi:hypothetical protein [Nocardia brasiliensis]|uniref:hypothetical protein n=1 Tax=Nocardia brasiliensis TaxID=37326 RepID=UPI003670335B
MIELSDVDVPRSASGRPDWQNPEWLAAVDEWISKSCADAGLSRIGAAQARCRMWSVVARVPVTGGQVWFKANPPGSGFEPALAQALSRWNPQDVPPVLAIDTDRRWALTADGGAQLDAVFTTDPDTRHWHMPIQRYARLQISLAGRLPDLAALGVPDLRPETLADTAAAMFADPGLLDGVATPPGPTEKEFLAARERLPALRAHCAELAALGIPNSLDHADLHPGNVLGWGCGARLFDWGDAVLGHPFGSLLVVLRKALEVCAVPRGGPEIRSLRDTYLQPWLAQGVSPDAAKRGMEFALSAAALARACAATRMFPCYSDNLWPRARAALWLSRVGATDPLTIGLDRATVPWRVSN